MIMAPTTKEKALKVALAIGATFVLGLAWIGYQDPSMGILLDRLPFCG